MKKIVLLFAIAFALSTFAQSNEKALIVSLMFNEGQMSFDNAFTQKGVYASEMNKGAVSGKIYSVEGDEVFSFKFEPNNKIVVEDLGVIEAKSFKEVLVLPYYENAEKIVFFNEETEQELVVPIGFLSKLCGNETCDVSEAFGNCAQDCPSGGQDSYCDRQEEGVCDPDCDPRWFDKDCQQPGGAGLSEQEIDEIVRQKTGKNEKTPESFPTEIVGIGIAAIIALIILGFVFMRKKRSE